MKTIIGAIHFPPMPGYEGYPGFDVALSGALADLKAFEEGGVTAIVIENNYDVPHKEKVSEEVRETMIRLGKELRKHSQLPFGVSVLWNDYESAFIIAKAIGASFIRVPVFVDTVKTSYGIMEGNPKKVTVTRHRLKAEEVKIYADIHVKHSEVLSDLSIEESALEAIHKGADALIMTGNWTGDQPSLEEIKRVRNAVGDFPILCGSGVNAENIATLFEYADGAIVSTALKEDSGKFDEVNVMPHEARINKEKVIRLMASIQTSQNA